MAKAGRGVPTRRCQPVEQLAHDTPHTRQEERSQRRLQGYRQGFQQGHALLARVREIQTALDSRPSLAKSIRCRQITCAREGANGTSELETVQLLFNLVSPDPTPQGFIPLNRIGTTIRQLSESAHCDLKKANWRCMNRACGKCTVTERVEFATAGERLACLRLLAAEARGLVAFPCADLPDVLAAGEAFAGAEVKERVVFYSSALAEEPSGLEEQAAVADALNALFDDTERLLALARDLDWHHAVCQAARSYPAEVVPQLTDCLCAAASDGLLGISEPLKRLALESLKHCGSEGQTSASQLELGRRAASLAVEELRTCVDREEQLRHECSPPDAHVTLTLTKVMVKSMIAPGWEQVMQVWSADPGAGEILRCPDGVGSLLQCLERTAEAGDTKGEFIKIQNLIVWRFILALHHDFGDDVQPALLQALHWTTVHADVWTKQHPRRRLAKVISRLAWTRWQMKLPGFFPEKLPPHLHAAAKSAPPIVLPLPPPPGLTRSFRRPLLGVVGVTLPPAPVVVDAACLSDPDEKVVSLLESALQAQSPPIDAGWLHGLRQSLRPPSVPQPTQTQPAQTQEEAAEAPQEASSGFSAEAPEFVPDFWVLTDEHLPPLPSLPPCHPWDVDGVEKKAQLFDQLMSQDALDFPDYGWTYWHDAAYYAQPLCGASDAARTPQSWITNGPY